MLVYQRVNHIIHLNRSFHCKPSILVIVHCKPSSYWWFSSKIWIQWAPKNPPSNLRITTSCFSAFSTSTWDQSTSFKHKGSRPVTGKLTVSKMSPFLGWDRFLFFMFQRVESWICYVYLQSPGRCIYIYKTVACWMSPSSPFWSPRNFYWLPMKLYMVREVYGSF